MALTSPVVVRAENQPNTPLGDTLAEIRRWFDKERIEPALFKTVAHSRGLGFEMSFKSETEDMPARRPTAPGSSVSEARIARYFPTGLRSLYH
jgi:hypothetical protein